MKPFILFKYLIVEGSDDMELLKIKEALKNNDEAFVELIKEKKDKCSRIAFRYCMNETVVEDVVSETIYKCYRYRKKCKQPEYFDSWMIRILINECIKEIKKNQKNCELIIDVKDDHYQDIALKSMVYDCKEPERSILILHFFEGLTLQEIASILDKPLNTIKTKYYRILKQFQIELKGEQYE